MTFIFQGLRYRLFNCALCAVLVLICRECDRGHRYCSKEHSKEGRRQKHAKSQADHQHNNHDTWTVAHQGHQKNYRDRERERERAEAARLALCTAAGGDCAVPVARPVAVADAPQTTASSSIRNPSTAPEKVVVTSYLITQAQQKETAGPVTVTADLTEKGFVRVAGAVQCLSLTTVGVQGPQLVDGVTPETQLTEERQQAGYRVTDHGLSGSQTQVKVSKQAYPATDNARERLAESRFRHKPICCVFC